MIGYIQGTVLEIGASEVLILPQGNGLGYYVSVVSDLLDVSVSDSIECFVYHYITDQGQKLFGFSSTAQRKLFLTLLGVNGLGPKWALSLLSVGQKKLIQAISEADEKEITRAQGVGPKLAKKIILELSGKLTLDEQVTDVAPKHTPDDDISQALQAMGYDKQRIQKVLASMPEDIVTVEEKTLYCIKQLATN